MTFIFVTDGPERALALTLEETDEMLRVAGYPLLLELKRPLSAAANTQASSLP